MPEITVAELPADSFERVNAMCVPSPPDAQDIQSAIRESAEAMREACARGLRVFGAFLDSEPVGRLEISPIESTPVPLTGHDAWVIRCIWVLEKAGGQGVGRRLLELALESVGSKPVAILTYDDWMPPAFFARFGFKEAQRHGEAVLMVRPGESAGDANAAESAVSYVPVKPQFELRPDCVRVDAVYTPRCPWRLVNVPRRLSSARELSDRVVTFAHPLNSREDALRLGEENIYVDGEPFSGPPVTAEVFLRTVTERLRAKGLK